MAKISDRKSLERWLKDRPVEDARLIAARPPLVNAHTYDHIAGMRVVLLIIMLFAWPAAAQTYPSYHSTTVNDFGELLSPEAEAALSRQLTELRRDTGVEMVVVTLSTQDEHAPGMTLEAFATGLFDHWGVGNAARNDGVMVLVIGQDRAMRIELGKAYGHDWDRVAQRVVDARFLPAFGQGDYARGIADGTTAIIRDIVGPFRAGKTPPNRALSMILFFGFVVAAVIALSYRQDLEDLLVRTRRCPSCGVRALRQKRLVLTPATTVTNGHGLRRRECSNCGHVTERPYVIARSSNFRSGHSGGGSFGGGSSGGGGASGRW